MPKNMSKYITKNISIRILNKISKNMSPQKKKSKYIFPINNIKKFLINIYIFK